MHFSRFLLGALVVSVAPTLASGQETYTIAVVKDAPPSALAPAVKETLKADGYRVTDGSGKPLATVWFRKAIPAATKPSGAKGNVQFPFLGEGELLGAVQFAAEGHDYRDQAIAPGVYTLRYGLQPVNGDHLGVSPFRDYALLLPAAKDKSLEPLVRKALETGSAEAAGSNHPAILMLIAAPTDTKTKPAIVHDEAKNLWGAVVDLPLAVKGGEASSLPVQLIVVGAAMN